MAFFAAARAGASRLLVSVSELSELTKPTFVNGRWRKPKVSARRAADIRKDNYKETGELIRDELKPVVEPRMKMNKWWRELPKRKEKIEERMKTMPKRIAEYREAVAEKKRVDPIDRVFRHLKK